MKNSAKGTQHMNRTDLQLISRVRTREAKILLDSAQYAGAYYLMGYAVECSIKSCIAKQTMKHQFPDKDLANKSHVHDLMALMQTAGIWQNLQADMKIHQALSDNWAVVKDWRVTSRYSAAVAPAVARDFYSACVARKHGVLSWIKSYW